MTTSDPRAQRRRLLVKLTIDAVCTTISLLAFVAWQVMHVAWAVVPLVIAVLVAVGGQVWLARAQKAERP